MKQEPVPVFPSDIIRKLGREKKISVDEVSDMFSLEMDKAMSVLEEK